MTFGSTSNRLSTGQKCCSRLSGRGLLMRRCGVCSTNQYHTKQYNSNALEADIKKLVLDDDVTKKAGIIPFILSDSTWRDEKHLSLRAFTESQKLRAYERQGHKCPLRVANGINTEYAFEDMEGDHIIPWSKGGHTTDDNLQMLCKKCNAAKSDK